MAYLVFLLNKRDGDLNFHLRDDNHLFLESQ